MDKETLFVIGILVVLTAIVGFILYDYTKEDYRCTTNAFVYGANQIYDSYKEDLICSCYSESNDPKFTFTFNRTQVTQYEHYWQPLNNLKR